MENSKWQEEAAALAKTDRWYQTWLADLQAVEPEYLALRNTLTQEQRETLDAYISACEAMDAALTAIAYELGRSHGIQAAMAEKQQKKSLR